MARTYENFDVELIASGPIYEARFRSVPGEPTLTISFPLEQHELEGFMSLFGKHQTRRLESAEFARVRAVGQRLFDSLFTDQVREALTVATRAAMQEGHGLRVRLDVSQARDLGTIPWEYMFFREYDDFVSLSNWTPVVRHLNVAEPLPPVRLDGPLRILVMISDPIERRGTLDVEREWAQLEQALEGPVRRGEIELSRLADGQLETLQVDLQRNSYHVFHFIGHGEYSEEHDDGVLALEDSRGREVHVSGNAIGTYLRDSLDTRLVVLNNCEGAAFESDPFTGSAQGLLRKGIPAVVAMQFEITDRAAIDFARGFYTSVGNGFPVDAALAEARKVIRGGPTRIEFGSPVLYMSADDGILFIRDEEPQIPDDAEATSLTPAVVAGVDLDEPVAEEAPTDLPADVETAPYSPEDIGAEGDGTGQEPVRKLEDEAPDTTPPTTEPLPEEDRSLHRRKWALAGIGIAGILGLVIIVNILGGDDPGPDATVDTPVETTASGTETTDAGTTPDPVLATSLAWSRVPAQDSLSGEGGEGGQFMHDILEIDGGWVAVGRERIDGVDRAAAWTSEDGIHWDRLGPGAFPDETDGTEIRSVVQFQGQLIAAGETDGNGRDAVVWTSDDGGEWTRVSNESFVDEGTQSIRSLTVWEHGLVAVGWDNRGDSEGAVWTSSDGLEWVRASDPGNALGGEGNQRIHDVVADGPGLVAVGETLFPGGLDAEIWTSADGDVWTREDTGHPNLSGEGDQNLKVIRAGSDFLLAGGFDSGPDGSRDAALWMSADGVTWEQVGDREVLGGPGSQEIHGLTAMGTGWVAAGWTYRTENDRNAAIWASEDGRAWILIDDPAAQFGGSDWQQIEAVAASGTTAIAVGMDWIDRIDGRDETSNVTIWVGQPD